MRIIFWVLLFIHSAFSPPSFAGELPGANDPDFLNVRGAWLADEEGSACRLLDLVDAGHPAAAFLYHGIRTLGFDDALLSCEKKGRQRLPVSSYFLEDVTDVYPEYAKLVLSRPPDIEAVSNAIAEGEPRATISMLWNLSNVVSPYDKEALLENWAAVSPQNSPQLDLDLQFRILTKLMIQFSRGEIEDQYWYNSIESACNSNTMSDDPFLPLTYYCSPKDLFDAQQFYGAFFSTDHDVQPNRHVVLLNDWLASDWRTEPYRTVCNTACPGSPDSCLWPLYEISGGAAVFFTIRTPSENLISQREFVATKRPADQIWQHIGGYFKKGSIRSLRENHPEASCLAEAIQNY